MKLTDFYPPPTDLLKKEARTLEYLSSNTYVKDKQGQLADAAAAHYKQIHATLPHLNFNSYLDVVHEDRPLRLVISAGIERSGKAEYKSISYCLTVCRLKRKRPSILRKFHFDIAIANNNGPRTQAHPLTHLQYCGKLTPYLIEQGCTTQQIDKLHPWLSEPRVFFWPMSLALLLDLVFREFPDPVCSKIRKPAEWHSIVRANEALLLSRFHSRCFDIVRNNVGANRTLADEFYAD